MESQQVNCKDLSPHNQCPFLDAIDLVACFFCLFGSGSAHGVNSRHAQKNAEKEYPPTYRAFQTYS